MEKPKNKPEIYTPTPDLYDVVKIDGRWAQVIGSAGTADKIRFLNNGEEKEIDWEEYELIKDFDGVPPDVLEESAGESISEEELERIQIKEEKSTNPVRRGVAGTLGVIGVFGEYKRSAVN